jgi:hypothetical protein
LSLGAISANGREPIGKLSLEASNCSCCHLLGSPGLRSTAATFLCRAAAVTPLVL